jgi:hypothetical protein
VNRGQGGADDDRLAVAFSAATCFSYARRFAFASARSKPRIPGGLGTLECVRAATDYYCRTPHIAFSVGTGPSLYIDRFVSQP